jgi:5-hydroxyisourate hydrolase-like protein (transthyretin family)
MRVVRTFAAGLTLWTSIFAAVCYGQAPGTSKDAKEKQETCQISGVVLKLADSAPLKNATVRLDNREDSEHREHTIATKTAADGRFELKNVPAGRYKLSVFRNGYVTAEYGQKKSSDPGATFTLSAGETKKDLIFRLIPAAVITGRVFDEDGEPVSGATVMASRETYDEGRRTLATRGSASTDDLGDFRLFGLAPGRYFISATERSWGQVEGDKEFSEGSGQTREQGYTKTYYPGTPDVARATAINVKEGDEIPGADIALKQVTVHRIRGRVLNQMTHKPGQDVVVLLTPRTKRQEWDFAGQPNVQKADGSFEIPNVVPGAYTLVAFWFDQTEGKNHSAAQKIDVGDSDVEGVQLTIGAGSTVQGRVVWEGKPGLERDELSISASPTEMMFELGGQARVDGNQQFTLRDLMEGDVRLQVSGVSKDCYVKQITFGQTFIKDDVISVAKGANPVLEITVSSRGARVQGSVADKDGLPAAGVWVVAVPDEARRTTFRLFKSQTTDQYGKFDLHGLAPGEYKFFAWEGVENNAWEDDDFLKPFEPQGAKLEVRDEDSTKVNLTAIAIKQTASN